MASGFSVPRRPIGNCNSVTETKDVGLSRFTNGGVCVTFICRKTPSKIAADIRVSGILMVEGRSRAVMGGRISRCSCGRGR